MKALAFFKEKQNVIAVNVLIYSELLFSLVP